MRRREAKRICFLLAWMVCLMLFWSGTEDIINPILLYSKAGLSGRLEEECLELMAPSLLSWDGRHGALRGDGWGSEQQNHAQTAAAVQERFDHAAEENAQGQEELWNLVAEENARGQEEHWNLAAEENARGQEELWNLVAEENARGQEELWNLVAEENARGQEEPWDLAAKENAQNAEVGDVGQPEAIYHAPTYERVKVINEESLGSFSELVKQFYVIDSTTMADETLLCAERFLAHDLRISKDVDGPQILIYHTHSQEAFADSEPGNPEHTVVGVGEELARILRENYGYEVLHHEGVYDKPSRNGAYSRALPEVEKLLEENPSLQVVIDLHRDEMPEGVRLVKEIDGKKTARFMFFNGLSRTKKTGVLTYLRNDYLEDNLAFSFQMEKAAQEYFPDLTRRIYLKGYRYNMHMAPRTLLIELGAQNNTFEEAMNACSPLAKLLDIVLSGDER